MKFPIFLDEQGDLSAFKNVETLRLYIEPIDIKNGEYQVFCADGKSVIPLVKNDGVQIQATNEKMQNELLGLINEFFQRTKPAIGTISALDLAVSAFVKNFGFCE